MAEQFFKGLITDEGVNNARQVITQEGWFIEPYKYEVANMAGDFVTSRDYDSRKTAWNTGTFTKIEKIENNKILLSFSLLGNASVMEEPIAEIYIICKNTETNQDFLLCLVQPTESMTFKPGITQEMNFIITLNNTDNADVFSLNYDFGYYQILSAKGQPNGYCPLDGNSKVPEIHLSNELDHKLVKSGTTITGGTVNLVRYTDYYTSIVSANTTYAFNVSNIGDIDSNELLKFNLCIVMNTLYSLTFPSNIVWENDTPPSITQTGVYFFEFISLDGGNIWYSKGSLGSSQTTYHTLTINISGASSPEITKQVTYGGNTTTYTGPMQIEDGKQVSIYISHPTYGSKTATTTMNADKTVTFTLSDSPSTSTVYSLDSDLTKIGSPTITSSGSASNFTTSNYVASTSDAASLISASNWEVHVEFYLTSVTASQPIFGHVYSGTSTGYYNDYGCLIWVDGNKKLRVRVDWLNNGSSSKLAIAGPTVVANTPYSITVKKDSSGYSCSGSVTGSNSNTNATQWSSSYPVCFGFLKGTGVNASSRAASNAVIDLKASYVKSNGTKVIDNTTTTTVHNYTWSVSGN